MPYAMSVILSRAIPEIDGFKPSHRKLLYTMYKMGLLQGARTKSANVVGQTMRLNPHGDAAIYETMVRLARGNESLLTPFVDSKGNFGKVYSRDMAYAASRYTEVKLDPFCGEIFADIDCDAVDFVDNYDGTMKEPTLLPTRFPNILVSANLGIAVGMASSICGFNLNEVCDTAIAYLKNPGCRLMDTLKGPDFPTGGELILDEGQMEEIYRTGRGSFRVRAKWNYLKKENIIEITEIPYTTTIEAIMDKVTDLIRQGKVREISDMRDESGLEGLKIAIDLKRGADPQKLMAKLMKMTPLMDTFGCNFNVLIGGTPRVLGVGQLLEEWSAWRMECIRRRVYFDLGKKKEKLHLLLGLRKILLDIDRAIAIIRDTEEDSEVVPNLMIGFGIDELQAEYVAEIKLRNINKEHILKRTRETDELAREIQELEGILADSRKIKNIIIGELREINKKYKTPRRTAIIYEDQVEQYDEEDQIEDYPVHIFLTREGYFKKITPQSLRMSGEQKVKEGDAVQMTVECTNKSEIIFLTDKVQAYKCRLHEFDDGKASLLGDYLPQKLQMSDGERVIFCFLPGDYSGHLLYVYENGKVAKIPVKSFDTKSNRRRLTGAYCDKSPLVSVLHLPEEGEVVLYSTDSRALVVSTAAVAAKATRSSQGVAVMALKKNKKVKKAVLLAESGIVNEARYRTRTLPAAGALLKEEDSPDKQLALEM
ncbi:DNA gyrase/topoisomerase IV subunit A [Intestinimonas butyriciproducens]|uniref:DNA gyrase/topoisomerase IV subunit A n=1 Tax=Intestinimonas butyriciproducens TaxID=1297617 RepID=UPI001958189B|nr:DNA topoisomerase (ATP-hydrolyzing) subunit A [Intestinimonas butyriciproducens]MBM6918361.1 topoisomerase IV [Intestinimonas butyriciproducens]